MRIQSCYIENFGKLHQFSFSPDPHLTVLVENNGWGKSTLAAFIKAMFYGLDYKPRAKLGENERKKYRPWQTGAYGGNLIFTQNGKTYRVERSFGNKASEDTFALYEEQTGRISEDFSANLGEELFAVDQVSYGYTTYLAQSQPEISGTDQIFSLLTGTEGTGSEQDMDSYSDAVRRLKEEAKQYKKTGGRGSIDMTINRITQAEQELRVAQAGMASYEEWNRKLEDCLKKIAVKKAALSEDQELVEKAGIAEGSRARLAQMDSLEKRRKDLKLQLSELTEHFPDLNEEKADRYRKDLEQLLRKAGELNEDRQEAVSKQTQLDTLSMVPVVVQEIPEEEDAEPEEKTGGIVWIVLAVLSGVLSALAGIFLTVAAWAGLLLTGFFLFLYGKKKKQAKEEAKNRRQQKEADRQRRRQQQKEAAQRTREKELEAYRENLARLKKSCEEREQELIRSLTGYHVKEVANYETAVVMLQEMLKNAEKLSRELSEVEKEIAELLQGGSADQLREAAKETIDLQSVRTRQKQDEDALYALLDEEKAYRSQLLRLEGAEEQAKELTEELEGLRVKLGEDEGAYAQIEMTLQLLSQAREQFSNRYADPVKQQFQKFAAALGFSEEEQPCLDAQLSLAVQAAGMQRETEYFSQGTRDLLWLCLRMAVVNCIFSKEKPFLILDDPFSELDEVHNRKAQAMVKSLAEEYQILYMTCHESRAREL